MGIWNGFDEADIEIHMDEMHYEAVDLNDPAELDDED